MILTPTPENLARATAYLDDVLDGQPCAAKTRIALETVLEEVFMNIVNHSGATVAELSVTAEAGEIVLRFADDGTPYDPLQREDPDVTLPVEERSIGGLGILMIRRMTDRQTYEYADGRNRLTLFKRIA
ncbi:MAG: ATP-binding protein [Clostridiales bacterium]|nr:ATP-binding protein [Clostridiales bacterium]